MRTSDILVTGCYRSGTTLVEKLLHAHKSIVVASQPFPVLYFSVKASFHKARGLNRRYPLDHLFLEGGYTPDEFHNFLDRFVLSSDALDQLFDELESYSRGLWTPEILRFRRKITPGVFFAVYRQLNECIGELFPKHRARYIGGKEVLCEEYIPYLIRQGVKVLLVIRDPRDMIASLNFRERDNLTGGHRPVLYSLRAWRKSVAFALALKSERDFAFLRYEDLVSDPKGVVQNITEFLALDPFRESAFTEDLKDQYGKPWQGNSSFYDQTGITRRSVGRYVEKLPQEMISFIEACCFPEMWVLSYDLRGPNRFDPDALRGYCDPFPIIHEKFPSDYSSSPSRIRDELERIKLLTNETNSLTLEEMRKWFIHEKAYRQLRCAVANA